MKTSWTPFPANARDRSTPVYPDNATGPSHGNSDLARLNRLANRISVAAPFDEILSEIIEIVTCCVNCDSCLVYVARKEDLVLRGWRNPHPKAASRVDIRDAIGIAGWVTRDPESVIVTQGAHADPRVKVFFDELLDDHFEAFLSAPMLSGGRLAGTINVQNRERYSFNEEQVKVIEILSFLVGTELERVRLERQNLALVNRVEARKIIERAKQILRRDFQLDEEEAYLKLQRKSRNRRTTMKEVAEAIILNDDVRNKT
jgi:uroporphyrinogen-III synthase